MGGNILLPGPNIAKLLKIGEVCSTGKSHVWLNSQPWCSSYTGWIYSYTFYIIIEYLYTFMPFKQWILNLQVKHRQKIYIQHEASSFFPFLQDQLLENSFCSHSPFSDLPLSYHDHPWAPEIWLFNLLFQTLYRELASTTWNTQHFKAGGAWPKPQWKLLSSHMSFFL